MQNLFRKLEVQIKRITIPKSEVLTEMLALFFILYIYNKFITEMI